LGRLGWTAAAALAALAAIAFWAPWRSATPALPAPLVRLDVDLGSDISLLRLVAPTFSSVALSPDGSRLAFVGSVAGSPTRLFQRRMDEAASTELAGTQGATNPFFSPDGQWVAFWSNGKLSKIPVSGGAAVQLAELSAMAGGSWEEDGDLIVGTGRPYPTGLFRIPDGGGTPTAVGKLLEEGEWFYTFPQVVRERKIALVAVVGSPPSIGASNIEAIALDGSSRKTIVRGATSPRYLPSGHLLYANLTGVFAVPFDLAALEVRGAPVPIFPDALFDPVTGGAQITASSNGTLVYRKNAGPSSVPMHVQWIDSSGKREPLLAKPGPYLGKPRISPDGRRVAIAMRDGPSQDIWVYESERDTMTRLTSAASLFASFSPVWTPDGRHVVFGSLGSGMFWTRADGAGQPQPLIAGGTFQFPTSVTSDGKRLAFDQIVSSPQVWSAEVIQDPAGFKVSAPSKFLETSTENSGAVFSPDGRWIAYQSIESGKFEVYVRPFSVSPSGNQGKVQISNNGGGQPAWMPNGRELLYQSSGQIMAVDVSMRADLLIVGKPRVWAANVNGAGGFDVSPDGKRIAILLPASANDTPRPDHTVVLLQNFFDELRRRAPAVR
jgi:serine/threonine-protein kinase